MPAAPTAGPFTLDHIARACGGRVDGDGAVLIRQVNTLERAGEGDIAFLANPKYRGQLAGTRASAVILTAADAAATPIPRLVSEQPYVTYARAALLLNPAAQPAAGIAATATIEPGAEVAASAAIGARAFVGAGACVGEGCVIHPGAVIGARSRLGARTVVHPNAVLYPDTVAGADCVIHAGAVLGSDGFGMAETGSGWLKIPQIGRVVLGDRVDIGANTTIDRGALDDTTIADDAKLDNQIQIGHNVRIGARTAIAGCVGIAGSVHVGSDCRIGGAAMISGHIAIGNGVTIAGGSVVAKSLPEPGVYAGVYPLDRMERWKRTAVRVRRLDELAARLEAAEQQLRGPAKRGPGE
jgi:UDP-3-O-[3-hydroxymyristoyl] glucosamine N-acyltransferase